MIIEGLIFSGILYLNLIRKEPPKKSPIEEFLLLLREYISIDSIKDSYDKINKISNELKNPQIKEKSKSVEIFDDDNNIIIFYNIQIIVAGVNCTGRLLSSGPLKVFISNNGKKIWHLNGPIPESYIY